MSSWLKSAGELKKKTPLDGQQERSTGTSNMNQLRTTTRLTSLISPSTTRRLQPPRLAIAKECFRPTIQNTNRTLFTSTQTITTLPTRLINLSKVVLLIGSLIGSYAYLTDTRATAHSWLTVPIIKFITHDDPEEAHHLAIKILKLLSKIQLIRDVPQPHDELLSFELWGKKFNNPIGMAAGFDKDGDALDGLFDIGFGYVEIGSITPEPQPGNPKPRMFRIPSTEAIVNRYGFNSEGHLAVLSKLRHRLLSYLDQHRHLGYSTLLSRYDNMNPVQTAYADSGFTHLVLPTSSASLETETGSLDQALGEIADEIEIPRSLRVGQVLAINLGKNKNSPAESVEDFRLGVERFGSLADVLVVNVSSPNTPGLRGLQSKDAFDRLLSDVVRARDQLPSTTNSKPNRPAVLVKIAPDLSVQELVDIGTVAKQAKVDGIIISNTTTSRPAGSGTEPGIKETGGLSGPPLKPLALKALSIVYAATEGAIPLVGCGGIKAAEDVLEYGRAGASFVQLYSALTYQGIGLPRTLKDRLAELLRTQEDGKNWSQIVGSQAQKIDLQQLIQDELKQIKTASYEDQVKEIKQTIEFIDQSLARFSTQDLPINPPVLKHAPEVKERPLPAAAALSNSPAPVHPPQITPNPPQQVDQERGILAHWKQTRQAQIDRHDFKRIV
ncbi:Dihydroorotate dehydrogenase (quinone), mitochondrial [Puccinia graminis f. sp. tritici]|uniref:Dihydroorotate dehydrogenase (quinone), mitochondrial n=1 Tax=Puccinia graminis f. sp. tritici TaxID=56615 RepID=A0A5B0MRF6_PUCGR|nr:Dihydroorotate dehydrogenase (quinone), mitochondrial [Puccinia graminis f. sp. tritici]